MRSTARAIARGSALASVLVLGAVLEIPNSLRAQGSPGDSTASRATADSLMRTGRAAEAAGNSRQALAIYSSAIRYAAGMTRAEEDTLHAIIFRTAAKLTPAPALPDSAMVYEVRAQIAFDSAKTLADFRDAAAEYNKAILSAPWIPRFYYNLAVLAERSGDLPRAADLYREYLLSPHIDDRDAVRRKLIALDYQRERAVASEEADKKRFAAFDELTGEWEMFSYVNNERPWYTYGRNSVVDTTSVYTFSGCCGNRRFGIAFRWSPYAHVSLVRQLDTLYVEVKGDSTWHGVITGPSIEDVKWYNLNRAKRYASCDHFEPSGLYETRGKIVTPSTGNRELHLVSVGMHSIGDGTCAIGNEPTTQYALAKPMIIRDLANGVTGAGTLGPTDLQTMEGQPYQVWRFPYVHGDKVRVDMVSSAFRPHIYMFERDEKGGLRIVLEDNGGGENGNARLEFKGGCDHDEILIAAAHQSIRTNGAHPESGREHSAMGPYSLSWTIVESPRERGEQTRGCNTANPSGGKPKS